MSKYNNLKQAFDIVRVQKILWWKGDREILVLDIGRLLLYIITFVIYISYEIQCVYPFKNGCDKCVCLCVWVCVWSCVCVCMWHKNFRYFCLICLYCKREPHELSINLDHLCEISLFWRIHTQAIGLVIAAKAVKTYVLYLYYSNCYSYYYSSHYYSSCQLK